MRLPIALLAALVSAVLTGDAASQSTNVRTSGACSPAIVRSQINGDLNITCGVGRPEVQRLRTQVQDVARRTRMTEQELDALILLVNEALAQGASNEAAIASINQRLERVEARERPAAVIADIRTLIDPNRDPAVQYLGDVRITLTGIDVGRGYVSFGFEARNQGMTDQRVTFMGGGANGRGSRMVVQGQIIPATEIDLGGRTRPGSVEVTLIPDVPIRGRVIFQGVRVNSEDIAVFELGHAYRNAAAQGHVRFQFEGR